MNKLINLLVPPVATGTLTAAGYWDAISHLLRDLSTMGAIIITAITIYKFINEQFNKKNKNEN
jgi:hypothetical protein